MRSVPGDRSPTQPRFGGQFDTAGSGYPALWVEMADHAEAVRGPPAMAKHVAAAAQAGMRFVPRSAEEIQRRFFTGLDLVEPGIVPVRMWRPNSPIADPRNVFIYAGVGHKPAPSR